MKSRRVIVRDEARVDLLDAKRWYEERRTGLGDEFVDAVDSAIAAAKQRPLSFRIVRGEVRRTLLRRFPYGVYFTVSSKAITIIAVFHARRDPKRWQDRA